MRKQKWFSLLLVLALLAVFAVGCNTANSAEATEAAEVTEPDAAEVTEATEADAEEATEAIETDAADDTANGDRNETKKDVEMINLDERALQKAPKEDAAVVDALEGIQTFQHESLTGKYSIPEGIIIRESYIEDGKVHIPPSGLYYTVRFSNIHTNPFGDNALYILGKQYYWADFKFNRDILTDATYSEVGDKVPFGDGSKSLELTGLSATSPGFNAPVATFSILKPSGNYYGSTFSASTDPLVMDAANGVLNNGTGRDSGVYQAGTDGNTWTQEYYSSSVSAGGATYLVADEVTTEKQVVKEFGTGSIEYALLSENAPERVTLGAGEKTTLGDWEAEVVSVGADTATVKLVNTQTNEEVEKELGPFNEENTSRLPTDQNQRNLFTLRPESNDVQVQLDILSEPFAEADKVKLIVHSDLIELGNGVTWPKDERFIYRPDT